MYIMRVTSFNIPTGFFYIYMIAESHDFLYILKIILSYYFNTLSPF
jgi:hypothetical protein